MFDPANDQLNLAKHGLSLVSAADFEMAVIPADRRREYGERRYRAFGKVDGVTCCMVFTIRDGDVRVVSLRRAHRKEYRHHVPEV